jgi:hypothetical protein
MSRGLTPLLSVFKSHKTAEIRWFSSTDRLVGVVSYNLRAQLFRNPLSEFLPTPRVESQASTLYSPYIVYIGTVASVFHGMIRGRGVGGACSYPHSHIKGNSVKADMHANVHVHVCLWYARVNIMILSWASSIGHTRRK